MNKMYLSAIAVAILTIGGVYGFNALSGDEEANQNTEETSQVETVDEALPEVEEQATTTDLDEPEAAEASTAGQYLEYNEKNLAATKDTKQVLFFHADWCPTCRGFEQKINEEGVPKGVTILKIDYDSNPDLRQQYGVPYTSYLVSVDSAGDLLDIWYTPETNSLKAVAERLGA